MHARRTLQVVLIGLSIALAVVLIVRGNVVIGVLVGALAGTRALLMVEAGHRRREFRRRVAERRMAGRPGGRRRPPSVV